MLIVHDEERGLEHFVREVAFSNVTERFGFVVPTPSKPGVFPMKSAGRGALFTALERAYPYASAAPGFGGGQGFGSGQGRGGGGLTVHEAKRVGSFAAFVLSATDAGALTKWLGDNGFVTTPASAEWSERYVRRGFYFVALRFEPSLAREKGPREQDGETLRITFETPVPYYPYEEPVREDLTGRRALALWLVSASAKVPVALSKTDGGYVRPFREGDKRFDAVAQDALRAVVGDEVWRDVAPRHGGPLTVQVFEDQKLRRDGFGDVLMLPATRAPLDDAAFEKRRPLFSLLDPTLEAAPAPKPASEPTQKGKTP